MIAGLSPEEGLRKWNLLFPLDNWWRKKYNIPFGSSGHLSVNPIDIYLEWVEEKQFSELVDEYHLSQEKAKSMQEGQWHTVRASVNGTSEIEEDFDFDDIKI